MEKKQLINFKSRYNKNIQSTWQIFEMINGEVTQRTMEKWHYCITRRYNKVYNKVFKVENKGEGRNIENEVHDRAVFRTYGLEWKTSEVGLPSKRQ